MSDPAPSDPSVLRDLAARIGNWARDRATARAFRGASYDGPEGTDGPVAQPDAGSGTELLQGLSLLWPAGSEGAATATVPEQTAVGLEISHLVAQIAPKRRFAPELDRILRSPLTDESAIRYRQDIVSDILECPELSNCCRVLAEQAVASSESFRLATEDRPRLFLVATRLAELQDSVDTVDALLDAMGRAAHLRSAGLTLLRTRMEKVSRSGWYTSLRSTVGRLRDAGLPCCTPSIRPPEDRVTTLRDAYNVNLAFRLLERGAEGGRAVGLAQLHAQSGMHVPAAEAQLSVADTQDLPATGQPTYRVVRASPRGRSYAQTVAQCTSGHWKASSGRVAWKEGP